MSNDSIPEYPAMSTFFKIDMPQQISFHETVTRLETARNMLRGMAHDARIHFIHSWRERSAEKHQQMVALVCESFALAHKTIDSLPDDILKIASEQSSRMGTFYHKRGGMPHREHEVFRYLMGAAHDFRIRKSYAERNIDRANNALEPFMGNDAVTWEQTKEHDKNLYLGWSTPLDKINHIGDEFYVLTLILNKVPEYICQSQEMMYRKFHNLK